MPDPKPRRTWRQRLRFRLSVRALMVVVLVLGGWLGWIVQRARVQREVVAAIKRADGSVLYDNLVPLHDLPRRRSPWRQMRRWMVDQLDINYAYRVNVVQFGQDYDRDPNEIDEVALQVARLGQVHSLNYLGGLSDVGLARLAGLRVVNLELCFTRVTDRGMGSLREIPGIVSLDLRNTEVGDEGLVPIASLPELRWLNLSFTRVRDPGVRVLERMTGLVDLDLSGTKIGDAGVARLKSLTGLKSLSLGWTQVSPAMIRELRAALPGTTIKPTPPPATW